MADCMWLRQVGRSTILLAMSALALLVGACGEPTHYWVITDAQVALPPITGNERTLERAGMPSELLEVGRGGDQTVLIIADINHDTARLDNDLSDTYIAVLDGPPAVVRVSHVAANEHLLTARILDGLRDLLAALQVASGDYYSGPLLGE